MDPMLNSNSMKMKLIKRQEKLKPYPNRSPRQIRGDLSGVRESSYDGADLKSEINNSGKIISSEICQIFQAAKEEAVNAISKIFETAEKKAEASMQKLGSECLGQAGHFKISSEVNKLSLGGVSKWLVGNKEINKETILHKTINEQSNVTLTISGEKTEAMIRENLEMFEAYISDCVKTTDLIAFFDLFTSTQTKELRSIFKINPKEASSKALKMIEKMTDQPRKYRQLLEALSDAGYPKVVEILNGTLIPLGSSHRQIIRQCAKHMFRRLNTSDILPYLFSKEVISSEDKQQIQQTERNESTCIAALELLDILPNRNKRWFKHFIQSLNESGHADLGKIIQANTPKVHNDKKEPDLPHSVNQKGKIINTIKTKQGRSFGMLKPKLLFPSDFQTANANNSSGEKETRDSHEVDKMSDDQRRSVSPFSVSSDDHSCVQASRLDNEFDVSDSSFPLE